MTFVCSIGNAPLAAVLWNGGISFGGVISFIFADLIIIPLLLAAVLVWRFFRTGGRPMLAMMGGNPDTTEESGPVHHHAH